MAKLEDIASLMNIDFPKKSNFHNKITGKKRRAWLSDNENHSINKENINTVNEEITFYKGSINQVNKHGLSTSIINQVNNPFTDKGSINSIYKPLLINLENLRGNPLSLIKFLFSVIKNGENNKTKKLTLTEITYMLEITRDSSRTALRFLLRNDLIYRVDFKVGKRGWSQYSIKSSLFTEIEKAIEKGVINPFKNSVKDGDEKGSNSSSCINTTTMESIEEVWSRVDVSPLSTIGFTHKHLMQLKTRNTPEVVQESIYHFSYGLLYNEKTKKYDDPLSVFMGVLRKGEVWIESNYRSPKERAQEALLNQKKEEKNRIQKMQEECYVLAFGDWQEQLTEKEIEEIAPTKTTKKFEIPQKARLGMYFKENIWPEKRKDYVY